MIASNEFLGVQITAFCLERAIYRDQQVSADFLSKNALLCYTATNSSSHVLPRKTIAGTLRFWIQVLVPINLIAGNSVSSSNVFNQRIQAANLGIRRFCIPHLRVRILMATEIAHKADPY